MATVTCKERQKCRFSNQKDLSPFPGKPPFVAQLPSNPSGQKESAPLLSTLETSNCYWIFAPGGALATGFKVR